jgi:SAM-dependent methyltransferase
MFPPSVKHFLSRLPSHARVLDYGTYDFSLAAFSAAHGFIFQWEACDIRAPETPAQGPFFHIPPVGKLPVPDAQYDAIVLSHVLEHLPEPIAALSEIWRILKPGGLLYIETPSDRSLLRRSHPNYARHGFFSFWDDPTHRRPYTPAALYRLVLGFGGECIEARYIGNALDWLIYPFIAVICWLRGDHHRWTDAAWRAHKFSCYAIAKRPATQSSVPDFRYLSFKKP